MSSIVENVWKMDQYRGRMNANAYLKWVRQQSEMAIPKLLYLISYKRQVGRGFTWLITLKNSTTINIVQFEKEQQFEASSWLQPFSDFRATSRRQPPTHQKTEQKTRTDESEKNQLLSLLFMLLCDDRKMNKKKIVRARNGVVLTEFVCLCLFISESIVRRNLSYYTSAWDEH